MLGGGDDSPDTVFLTTPFSAVDETGARVVFQGGARPTGASDPLQGVPQYCGFAVVDKKKGRLQQTAPCGGGSFDVSVFI